MTDHKMPMKDTKTLPETESATTTPLDRLRSMSTVARKVHPKREKAVDAMLAVYNGRLTYTFIAGHEVASIHFDQKRGEIFYKGHNAKTMAMGDEVRGYLWELADILAHDDQGMIYSNEYSATLRKVLADK